MKWSVTRMAGLSIALACAVFSTAAAADKAAEKEPTVEEVVGMSKKTGRPILAVLGKET